MLRCVYCGDRATTRDHAHPQSGPPHPILGARNTLPACLACNKNKRDATWWEWLQTVPEPGRVAERVALYADWLVARGVRRVDVRLAWAIADLGTEAARRRAGGVVVSVQELNRRLESRQRCRDSGASKARKYKVRYRTVDWPSGWVDDPEDRKRLHRAVSE